VASQFAVMTEPPAFLNCLLRISGLVMALIGSLFSILVVSHLFFVFISLVTTVMSSILRLGTKWKTCVEIKVAMLEL
jgi:hypothetical protein